MVILKYKYLVFINRNVAKLKFKFFYYLKLICCCCGILVISYIFNMYLKKERIAMDNDLFRKFFVENPKRMLLIRLPGVILLLISLLFLAGVFGNSPIVMVGWVLILAAFFWFVFAGGFKINSKVVGASAKEAFQREVFMAQEAFRENGFENFANTDIKFISEQYITDCGAVIKKATSEKYGYISSKAAVHGICTNMKDGKLFLYKSEWDFISGERSTFGQIFDFKQIKAVSTVPNEYRKDGVAYQKRLYMDIEVGGKCIRLLFDDDYDVGMVAKVLAGKVYGNS